MKRGYALELILENSITNEKALLDSLVQAMSDDQFFDLIDYVSRVEDWSHKFDSQGTCTDEKGKVVKYDKSR